MTRDVDESHCATPSHDYYLGGTTAHHLKSQHSDLLDRLTPLSNWFDTRLEAGVDPYCKQSHGPIEAECSSQDRLGRCFEGVNLASQDYLSLAYHPAIRRAAIEAVDRYGVHSAGSPALMGNTQASGELERQLADFVGMDNCTVFATGWAAGYGLIKALVRASDHIIIDQLAHASLIEGARGATSHIHTFPHLSVAGLERRLKRVRAQYPDAGILVVTETLFSMDSDTPDLAAHQALATRYSATLMVDAAHDLGCMGPTGRGQLEAQGMVGKIDLLMGSFSKTFASNGGFVASNHPALQIHLRTGCGPHTFSNAISPVQATVVSTALEIIQSAEGDRLRQGMMQNALLLRSKLSDAGYPVMGEPSAIIPAILGSTARARLITRFTLEKGGLVNLVEYPAVAKNASRFRLQVMATHTPEQLERFVDILMAAGEQADKMLASLAAENPHNLAEAV